MSQRILFRILTFFLFTTVFFEADAKDRGQEFTVIIDEGHGGKDLGATDNGVMEKNINLAVAKQLESLIKKKMKKSRVVMTRNSDNYLTLQERADIANKNKGDLFISIHTNSVDKKNKNRKTIAGSSVYALGLHKDDNNMQVAQRENSVIELESNFEQKYSGFDPMKDESYIIFEMAQKKNLSKSIKFAEDVQTELVASGRTDRGVHQAGFWVLWATSMPSVLIELDFICNPESASYISSQKGAEELAEAIFKALQKYEQTWEKSNQILISEETREEKNYSNDTYIDSKSNLSSEKETSSLPEEYVQVASRTKTRISSPRPEIKNFNQNSGRKRRSAEGREKAANLDYESTTLNPENFKGTYISQTEEDLVLAQNIEEPKKADSKEKKREEKKKKEKKADKKSEVKPERTRNAKVAKTTTVYMIQILASSESLKPNNPRFCGLKPISTYRENNLYKYFYGESSDKEEIEELLKAVQKKIPDAFIVATTKSKR